MDKLSKAIQVLEDQINYSVRNMDEVSVELDFESADVILELLKEFNRSKHGHWIVLQNCSNSGVYCSECMNKMFDRYPMKKKFSQYCGHCGAHNDLQIEVR